MKKIILGLLLGFVVSFNLCIAATNNVRIMKDNQFLQLSVSPIKKDGRVLVPLSDIAKAMNINMEWEQETKTIKYVNNQEAIYKLSVGSKNVEIAEGDSTKTIQIDAPPTIYNNKVFVPVRFIAESFNINTEWDGVYNVVYIGQCQKLGYYKEFPSVPSFERIIPGKPDALKENMPAVIVYRHICPKQNESKALELYLNLLKKSGFNVSGKDVNYLELYEQDWNGNQKLISKKLESFTAISNDGKLKVKAFINVHSLGYDLDYKTRTKTIYGGKEIVIRINDLNYEQPRGLLMQ